MDKRIEKLYAAYRSGCLGDNIFDAYFPFLANIIFEGKWDYVDEIQVAEKFKDKYQIHLPLNFVRQILGVGMEKNVFLYDKGKYITQKDNLRLYSIDNKDFDILWDQMMEGFVSYCKKKNVDISGIDVESSIFSFLDVYDEAIVSNDELNVKAESNIFNYIWNSYLKYISEQNPPLFNFVAAISFSNIQKETIFYSNDSTSFSQKTFNGLNVYLDSPMVFALLGMDSIARVESCKMLISEMKASGCIVQVFDHNFNEIKGIMARAAGWATSSNYSIQKANNVAQFFHDELQEAPIIAEFCDLTEIKLNELGITIKSTSYDVSSNDFQEDESVLYSMLEKRYIQNGRTLPEEKKQSILVDVRSIIMAYRERRGQVSTQIQTSGHVVITLNGLLANVSKDFESNRSINSGHVPACVSADLFGSVLWLFSPQKKMEYQRKQLLADCYVALRPSKEMLDKYVDSLNRARNVNEIDEKTFLFMLAHVAVNDALMNVTKGDYARFNDQTYREVYDEIVSQANKKYTDESSAHAHTKEKLIEIELSNMQLTDKINNLQARLDSRDQIDLERRCKRWGWMLTILLFGIPYIVVVAVIEILKSQYSEFSFYSLVYVVALGLISILAGVFFNKGKKWCFSKCHVYFSKR